MYRIFKARLALLSYLDSAEMNELLKSEQIYTVKGNKWTQSSLRIFVFKFLCHEAINYIII